MYSLYSASVMSFGDREYFSHRVWVKLRSSAFSLSAAEVLDVLS